MHQNNQQCDAAQLIGSTIELQLSDPWEAVSKIGDGPMRAVIVATKLQSLPNQNGTLSKQSILVRIAQPFTFSGQQYEYFLLSPRQTGSGIEDMSTGKALPSNLLHVSEDIGCSDDPFSAQEVTKWRGGGAFIGTATMVSGESV